MVDNLLRAPFYLGVAALHRIKIKLRGVGPGRHGTGRAAAHADAHAGAAELDQQAACGKLNLVRLGRVNHAQATGNHDRLVVAALFLHVAVRCAVRNRLLIFTEVAQQIGAAKFVVEGSATQRPFNHDLQWAGDVLGLAVGDQNGGQNPICRTAHCVVRSGNLDQTPIFGFNWNLTPIDFGHREPGQPGFGFRAATGGTFVANLTARAGGRTGKRRDRGGMVVGFHLH